MNRTKRKRKNTYRVRTRTVGQFRGQISELQGVLDLNNLFFRLRRVKLKSGFSLKAVCLLGWRPPLIGFRFDHTDIITPIG